MPVDTRHASRADRTRPVVSDESSEVSETGCRGRGPEPEPAIRRLRSAGADRRPASILVHDARCFRPRSRRLRPATGPPVTRSAWFRTVAVGGLGGVFVWSVLDRGVPKEREQVLAWALAAIVVATAGDGSLRARRAVLDWVPFAALLVAYDYTRGAADTLGMPIQTQLPIVMDKVVFFGEVPSVWLQDHLAPFTGERWWEGGMAITYMSHFTVPFVVAAGFWLTSRPRFVGYVRRFMTLTATGLATYILVPTRPPWMASEMGEIGEIERVSTRGWRALGLHSAEQVIDRGQATVNRVAALPSLHAGFSMLVAVSLWPVAPRWLRPLVAAYPIAMTATLVIGGEHYFFDAWLGFVYVAVVCWAWNRWDRRAAGAAATGRTPTDTGTGSDAEVDPDPVAVPGGIAPGGGEGPAALEPELQVVFDRVPDGAMALERSPARRGRPRLTPALWRSTRHAARAPHPRRGTRRRPRPSDGRTRPPRRRWPTGASPPGGCPPGDRTAGVRRRRPPSDRPVAGRSPRTARRPPARLDRTPAPPPLDPR